MSKVAVIIIGIILAILGILALIPALHFATLWFAIVLLVIGIIGVVLGIVDKKRIA